MKEHFDLKDLVQIIDRLDKTFQAQKEHLSDLDSKIGDGDHGFNMAKGFRQFNQRAAELSKLTIGDFLQKGGSELVKTIGGAAGAIFGTMFTGQALYYSQHLKDKDSLNIKEVAAMWNCALEQIKRIGKAEPGDKTMVDALEPAVHALKSAAESGSNFEEAFTRASIAARSGAEATAGMIGKCGRAKHLGERSVGRVDAGAMSIAMIMQIFAAHFSGE